MIPQPVDLEEHTPENPMYPEITIQLSGTDGNVFALAGEVARQLKRCGAAKEDVDFFRTQLFECGSYEEALELMATMAVVV